MHDNNSLAHTSWNCKYHVVFAPKYRRKIFYGQNWAKDTERIMRLERSAYSRSRSVPGQYPYVSRDTTQNERIRIYGISKRKE